MKISVYGLLVLAGLAAFSACDGQEEPAPLPSRVEVVSPAAGAELVRSAQIRTRAAEGIDSVFIRIDSVVVGAYPPSGSEGVVEVPDLIHWADGEVHRISAVGTSAATGRVASRPVPVTIKALDLGLQHTLTPFSDGTYDLRFTISPDRTISVLGIGLVHGPYTIVRLWNGSAYPFREGVRVPVPQAGDVAKGMLDELTGTWEVTVLLETPYPEARPPFLLTYEVVR